MQATSRDWLNLIITATPVPDFAAQAVEVSLSPDQFNPTTDWFPAEHTAQGLRLMIGPGTDPGQLQPGSWHAWGRLTALGDGTLPVFYIGAFLIEGGSGLAPMPPTTIGQAALDAAINGVLPGGLDPAAAALVGSGGAFDLSLKAALVPRDQIIAAPVYNAAGLPTSVTEGGVTTLYTYSPDGTPATQKVGDGPVRTFVYNADGSFGGLA